MCYTVSSGGEPAPHRWSAKHGPCPAGDQDLHHYVGELLYKGPLFRSIMYIPLTTHRLAEGAFEAAEPHFLASGKRDSARLLADMFIQWSSTGGSPGAFALRGTLPYAFLCLFGLQTDGRSLVICRMATYSQLVHSSCTLRLPFPKPSIYHQVNLFRSVPLAKSF